MDYSSNPSGSPPNEWYWFSPTTPADSTFVASEGEFFPQDLYEYPLVPTSPNLPIGVPDLSSLPLQIAAIWSASTPMPPPPQTPTFPPPKWYRIPQNIYSYGRRQLDFVPSESIYFGVNGHPGVNMRDALLENFAGLDFRDELVLQDASSAISCRLSFPGYPLNTSPQISTTRYNKGRDPIRRSRLAYLVARKLNSYLDSMAPRPYSVGESTPLKWKIGKGFMRLENMFMVRLDSVSNGSWQPEVWVMDPTM